MGKAGGRDKYPIFWSTWPQLRERSRRWYKVTPTPLANNPLASESEEDTRRQKKNLILIFVILWHFLISTLILFVQRAALSGVVKFGHLNLKNWFFTQNKSLISQRYDNKILESKSWNNFFKNNLGSLKVLFTFLNKTIKYIFIKCLNSFCLFFQCLSMFNRLKLF